MSNLPPSVPTPRPRPPAGGSDAIDLLSRAATKLSFAAGTLTVQDGTATVATLKFAGSYATGNFALGSDGHGGSLITYHA